MAANLGTEFFKLTAQQTPQTSSVGSNPQTQGANQAQNDKNALQKTDVFTAQKNGMQPAAMQKDKLAGGDSGFTGTNAFGDTGFGDTVSFSTKAQKPEDGSNTSAGAQRMGGGMSFANNDSEIQQIAEALGCKADEDTVKSKLQSMKPEDLVKLDGDVLDMAADIGLVSMGDIEKQLGAGKSNDSGADSKEQQQKKMLAFGSFTSGSEV